MGKVFLDTSAILFSFRNKKDIFNIVSNVFPTSNAIISVGVIRELTKNGTNKGKKGSVARTSLSILKSKNIKVDNIDMNVDNWIFKKASRFDVVVTNDTELISKLNKKRVTCFKVSKSGALKKVMLIRGE
ncbi:DUF188 domain-containing protein [Candidatus Marsarchaeota archaeon]|nr:DUF188 domain-containing protein [Candidatus Marsarchaeota archaeon]MCL5089662.1 DUF188 domain-containing protein [Candidatus Marsarchaeota archaeon]